MTLLLCVKLAVVLIVWALLMQLNHSLVEPPASWAISLALGIGCGLVISRIVWEDE